MDWSALLPVIGKFGVPILKAGIQAGLGSIPVLGGFIAAPAADAVGKLIADALGVDATPEKVKEAIETRPRDDIDAKLQAANAMAAAKWPALVEIAKAEEETAQVQIKATTEQMKNELVATETIPEGRWRTFIIIANAGWRPLYAVEFLCECGFFFFGVTVQVMYAIATNQYQDIDAILKLQPVIVTLLLPYMAARFGILGYHMKLRTNEKEMVANVAAGEAPSGPPAIDSKLVKALLQAAGVKVK